MWAEIFNFSINENKISPLVLFTLTEDFANLDQTFAYFVLKMSVILLKLTLKKVNI